MKNKKDELLKWFQDFFDAANATAGDYDTCFIDTRIGDDEKGLYFETTLVDNDETLFLLDDLGLSKVRIKELRDGKGSYYRSVTIEWPYERESSVCTQPFDFFALHYV